MEGPGERARRCGPCSLCCTVLRVDPLRKLGGVDCVHQRGEAGCAIHATRPGLCRAYACLWLRGGLEEPDRPDRLGAVLDLQTDGGAPRLSIRQARPDALERSPRLREIAERFRQSMPVRISDVGDVLDAERPVRVLLPDGTEQRIEGDVAITLRDGKTLASRRAPWLERSVRRLALAFTRWRVRHYRGYPGGRPG